MSSAGVVLALRQRAERRLADRLRLRRMVAVGAVREAASGAYYLDEAAFAAYQYRRRRRILVALGGLLAALGIAGLRRR